MDWDHLRYFLELARTRKLSSAARRLDVQHTTVARRIRALEQAVGAPLFMRTGGEYQVSEQGRRLLPHAEAMEAACRTIAGAAPERTGALSGLVRIGATEGFGTVVLAPALARFGQQHSQLVIDLLAVPRSVNLSQREADIVISLERPARGNVVVRRLCNYVLRLYASPRYLATHPVIATREDLQQHVFISYIDDLLFSKELRYLAELCRAERFALRSTSVLAQHQATVAGAGIAVLPAFIADGDARLQQVLPGQARFERTFWMSMASENRPLARMQAVWAMLVDMAEANAPLLAGQSSASDGGQGPARLADARLSADG
ncbi:LysR family transcriptional regulator [Pseudorhodoferax sp. Leaf267]|uniref:LysR family transcriptional regulator n=1 Tax=Pseudorhodoferax sp. Leaf267 TaxID=1736316 RepID=UPI0009E7313F|nr:LysR family transcriptional regulator [Pseudorhodoferax sp. Leaf267]